MSSRPITDGDPLWYKDAIIYEVNLKGFRDSNRDGIGDFAGLTEKLDYIQDLGATVIWVLPFYPSPLRDDGYDIADYRSILPAYGTLSDFKRFLRAAHERGLRVMIELVIDHTSDQHPWFQAARRAPAGSSKRDWYVWSDTTEKYKDARIIFTDTERSNWAWDEEAKQYYWHRFFSHQPNLNFANPAVRVAVRRVMEYWFDMGVDAMRLDAIPYLFQREGTNCENLPEVHDVLKELRAFVDRRYSERFFLAEANQWPSDVLQYFGDGDECHMAYHFPLMPRMYMALARENRHAIVDILRNTPAIPDVCQWAVFLRNHDELTLEMVTDEDRDYMYREYARDPRMKCNVGIRRRLAPLMDFNRPAIELLNNLLFTMPGTPVIYYGDEIGMSDNIYLGDRNGVRTPMQWSLDRNGGFSEADAAQLYAPVLLDPLGGFPAVTVEAQQRNQSSLLHWMRRLIALRRRHTAFSRGSFHMLEPENQKVLAYVRTYRDETILVVSNLSRLAQPVSLDLAAWRGRVPVEMFGRTPFPQISDAPYFLTLAPHGFLWLNLEVAHDAAEGWRALELRPAAVDKPPALTISGLAAQALSGVDLRRIEDGLLPAFLRSQPWFRSRDREIEAVRLIERMEVPTDVEGARLWVAFALVRYTRGPIETYLLPLEVLTGAAATAAHAQGPTRIVGTLEGPEGASVLRDATVSPALVRAFLAASARGDELVGQDGRVLFRKTMAHAELAGGLESDPLEVQAPAAEQTNTSLFVNRRIVLKTFRRLEAGIHPEIEMARHLTDSVACIAVPRTAAWAVYRRRDGSTFALALMQELVENEGDAWSWTVDYLGQLYEAFLAGPRPEPGTPAFAARVVDLAGSYPDLAETLGGRTAELHHALAESSQSFAFFPEPVTAGDRRRWFGEATARAREAVEALDRLRGTLPRYETSIAAVIAARKEIRAAYLRAKSVPLKAARTRVHGDYHLGQVLVAHGDVRILDFEGLIERPMTGRRDKELPLIDVASMLRSFQYASAVPLDRAAEGRDKDLGYLSEVADAWQELVSRSFLTGYHKAASDNVGYPPERATFDTMLRALMIDKAVRELLYEAKHRAAWVGIPVRGLARLLKKS